MIRINKSRQNEPRSWINYRRTPGVEYQASEDLRNALLREQGYICAYCMRRIPTKDPDTPEESHIEHIKCIHNHQGLQLDYRNMVICCPGNIDGNEHCDRSKHNSNISFDLFDALLQNSISYSFRTGEIKSNNVVWNNEINEILNLNNPLQMLNRRDTLDGVIDAIEFNRRAVQQIRQILLEWSQFDGEGKLHPYCGIIIWFLGRRLRQQLINNQQNKRPATKK